MRVVRRTIVRSAALLCLSTSTVAVLAGCGTDDLSFGQTGQTGRATATVTAPEEVSPSTTPLPSTTTVTAVVPAAGGSENPGRTAGTGCAPNIGTSAAAARDAARISPPQPDGQWRAYNAGGAWCPGLSWIELDRAESRAPIRAHQLLIYHGGYFQGTGIRCDAQYGQYVLSTAPDAITVQYTYIDETDPAQQHSQGGVGKVSVTFRWNGSRVVMDGSLPYAFTQGKC